MRLFAALVMVVALLACGQTGPLRPAEPPEESLLAPE